MAKWWQNKKITQKDLISLGFFINIIYIFTGDVVDGNKIINKKRY